MDDLAVSGSVAAPRSGAVRVGAVHELPPRARRVVRVESTDVLVVRVDDAFHAIENACPHHGAPLDWSRVRCGAGDSAWVTCPLHGWEIDVRTGEVYGLRAAARTFCVEVVDEAVWVSEQPPVGE